MAAASRGAMVVPLARIDSPSGQRCRPRASLGQAGALDRTGHHFLPHGGSRQACGRTQLHERLTVFPSWIARQVADARELLQEAPEQARTGFERLGLSLVVSPIHDGQKPFLRAVGSANLLSAVIGRQFDLPASGRFPLDRDSEVTSAARSAVIAPEGSAPARRGASCRGGTASRRARPCRCWRLSWPG